jgi:hypothetical protein
MDWKDGKTGSGMKLKGRVAGRERARRGRAGERERKRRKSTVLLTRQLRVVTAQWKEREEKAWSC